MELAEIVNWPELKITSPATVCPGEYNWRVFLHKSDVLTLRDNVMPMLKALIASTQPPDDSKLDTAEDAE